MALPDALAGALGSLRVSSNSASPSGARRVPGAALTPVGRRCAVPLESDREREHSRAARCACGALGVGVNPEQPGDGLGCAGGQGIRTHRCDEVPQRRALLAAGGREAGGRAFGVGHAGLSFVAAPVPAAAVVPGQAGALLLPDRSPRQGDRLRVSCRASGSRRKSRQARARRSLSRGGERTVRWWRAPGARVARGGECRGGGSVRARPDAASCSAGARLRNQGCSAAVAAGSLRCPRGCTTCARCTRGPRARSPENTADG